MNKTVAEAIFSELSEAVEDLQTHNVESARFMASASKVIVTDDHPEWVEKSFDQIQKLMTELGSHILGDSTLTLEARSAEEEAWKTRVTLLEILNNRFAMALRDFQTEINDGIVSLMLSERDEQLVRHISDKALANSMSPFREELERDLELSIAEVDRISKEIRDINREERDSWPKAITPVSYFSKKSIVERLQVSVKQLDVLSREQHITWWDCQSQIEQAMSRVEDAAEMLDKVDFCTRQHWQPKEVYSRQTGEEIVGLIDRQEERLTNFLIDPEDSHENWPAVNQKKAVISSCFDNVRRLVQQMETLDDKPSIRIEHVGQKEDSFGEKMAKYALYSDLALHFDQILQQTEENIQRNAALFHDFAYSSRGRIHEATMMGLKQDSGGTDNILEQHEGEQSIISERLGSMWRKLENDIREAIGLMAPSN